MKVLECIADTIIRQELDIDKKQFGFVPSHSTIDATFSLRQMQEKHHLKRKTMCAAFYSLCWKLKSDSHLPTRNCFIFFIESPLKMMKNAFYFVLKALFVLKIFKFLS